MIDRLQYYQIIVIRNNLVGFFGYMTSGRKDPLILYINNIDGKITDEL